MATRRGTFFLGTRSATSSNAGVNIRNNRATIVSRVRSALSRQAASPSRGRTSGS